MKDLTKEELETTLQLLADEVKKIKKQYICGQGEHGDGLTAEEGFDMLIERIGKKIKKASNGA
jgi:peroxiredoxin